MEVPDFGVKPKPKLFKGKTSCLVPQRITHFLDDIKPVVVFYTLPETVLLYFHKFCFLVSIKFAKELFHLESKKKKK